jgi:RHS repeat-associated protein
MSVTFGNSVQGAFTYNDHLQLSTLRYFKGTSEILNLGYDYTTTGVPGNNGQIQRMHYYTAPGAEDQTKSENFTYDTLGRLSAAQTGVVNSTSGAKTWSLQWTYDRLGNRLTQAMVGGDPTLPVSQPNFTVDPATNRITNTGYTYDAAGNMTHDATAAYAYDGANRLININTTSAIYSYFGPQRVKKVISSGTTRYIYSGNKPIAEYTGTTSPTLSTEYIYAGSQLLVTIAGSTTTYHHPDHLSNRAETNSSGTRTRTFGHLPFGETWYETTPVDKWKFTSYERDSGTGETGLDYANFRYYASGQGRFMSGDLMPGHIGLPQSFNRYSYTRNDPVNLVDPLGLDSSAPSMSWQCVGSVCTYTMSGGSTTDVFGEWGLFGGGGGSGGYYAPLLDGSGGGGGSQNDAAKTVLNNSDCFAFIMDLLSKLFGQQNVDQAKSINRMTPDQRSNLFQAQHDAVQPMSFVGTIQALNVSVSSTPNTDNDSVAKTEGMSVTLYPSFFSPDNDRAETFIHEAFHSGSYNFKDTDMARALGIPFKTWQEASQKWDKELEKHCGKDKKN